MDFYNLKGSEELRQKRLLKIARFLFLQVSVQLFFCLQYESRSWSDLISGIFSFSSILHDILESSLCLLATFTFKDYLKVTASLWSIQKSKVILPRGFQKLFGGVAEIFFIVFLDVSRTLTIKIFAGIFFLQ